MQKSLYFVCPTDCMETIITKTFDKEQFFYATLGNCLSLDIDTLTGLKDCIEREQITSVCFVLADDNKIIKEATEGQLFSEIKVLRDLCAELTKQSRHCNLLCEKKNAYIAVLSYYLNKRIEMFNNSISFFLKHPVKLHAKIYQRRKARFINTYHSLFFIENYVLN